MRRLSLLLVLCSMLFVKYSAVAQSNIKLDEDSILFNISTDVQDELRNLWPTPQNIKWSRQVYREIFFADSTVANVANSKLKYPDEPVTTYAVEGGVTKLTTKQNLFWLIFKLAMSHKIPVYQSNDYLTFTENDKITQDTTILSNLKYITEGKGKYVVKDVYTRSVNSSVLGYLIKENYYFDAEVSELRSQVVAIAPLIESTTMGGDRDYTIPFWVTYETIVPWLMNYSIVASENNNADIVSFDTYFKKRMFKGNIIKIENPLNYTIAKQCSECCPDNVVDCIKKKQGELEAQILSFDQKQLWAQPYVEKKKEKASRKSSTKAKKSSSSKKKVSEAEIDAVDTSTTLVNDTTSSVPVKIAKEKKTKPVKKSTKSSKSKKKVSSVEDIPTSTQE
ncbi:MAG: gliding motility protein GldN [Bacteroidales bacterium]|nr:gliding motility protein GldN [Bacteroidales bacterium]